MIDIINCGKSIGLNVIPTVAYFNDNVNDLPVLIDLLKDLGCKKILGFIQDYRGNGKKVDCLRLEKSQYDILPNLHTLIKVALPFE